MLRADFRMLAFTAVGISRRPASSRVYDFLYDARRASQRRRHRPAYCAVGLRAFDTCRLRYCPPAMRDGLLGAGTMVSSRL